MYYCHPTSFKADFWTQFKVLETKSQPKSYHWRIPLWMIKWRTPFSEWTVRSNQKSNNSNWISWCWKQENHCLRRCQPLRLKMQWTFHLYLILQNYKIWGFEHTHVPHGTSHNLTLFHHPLEIFKSSIFKTIQLSWHDFKIIIRIRSSATLSLHFYCQ